MKNFKEYLEKLNACHSAVKWVGDKTLAEAWSTTDRGDWMLWLAKKADVDLRTLTKAKVECAKLVKHLMSDERSLRALEVAERFADGKATREELDDAAAAAAAAYAASAYAASAYAAYAAVAAAAYAAAAAAANVLAQASDICRKYIPVSLIEKAMEAA